MEEDRYTRITLRLPRDLHARLDGAADATSKSLNAEIVGRLEKSFGTEQRASADALMREMRRTQLRLELNEIDHESARMFALRQEVQNALRPDATAKDIRAAQDQLATMKKDQARLEQRRAVILARLSEASTSLDVSAEAPSERAEAIGRRKRVPLDPNT